MNEMTKCKNNHRLLLRDQNESDPECICNSI